MIDDDESNNYRRLWTCHYCRMTWTGGTAPPDLTCPDCGSQLEEEDES